MYAPLSARPQALPANEYHPFREQMVPRRNGKQ